MIRRSGQIDMKRNHTWKWFVWGKHPGVEDFISAGSQTPLFQRFTKWVDNGFMRIGADSELRSGHRSWRFWTKGTEDEVVCGLVRNSCDSYGRSFPLLYIGAGDLQNWAANCSLLPFAFESVWKSLEYVAAARYHSVEQLAEALQLIQPPESTWRQYQRRIYNAPNLYTEANSDEQVDGQKQLFKIDCERPENLPRHLIFCNNVMTKDEIDAPMAVFIGEIGSCVAVAMVHTMLHPSDFTWLWSLREDTGPQD